MKIYSGANAKKLDRSAAMACVGINLLATPGLGTIIAGRYLAGTLQLLAACAGFGLIIGWFVVLFQAMMNSAEAGHAWMWVSGLAWFGASWLGALWSSLAILKQAKANAAKLPPKLDGSLG